MEAPRPPSSSVIALAPLLPERGRALDVAGGAGRHALWLAARGLDVTLVDISEAGLGLARAAAAAAGLPLATRALDLDEAPLPPGPWDLILCTFFLDRRVFVGLPALLAPGGTLVVVHATLRNLERHARPPAGFLLAPGELAELQLAAGLELVEHHEGWTDGGAHEARLVARRR